ncbi:integrin beta-PS [Nephila pilipes]|uniref:Integrin beta n=1 Tax=Nephila pilipes TaxID=299642 RepID=A0A8X6MA46_NEPPI|nr:integrin beta-PS [Nephila pilipes]
MNKHKIASLISIFRIIFIIHIIFEGVICNNCHSKETCGQCIAESDLCAWCTQANFSVNGAPRCDFLTTLKETCNASDIVAPEGSLDLIKDMSLSDKGAKEGEAIQVKPQEIRIRLRPNSVQKLTVEFRQAVDYPIDLYYLMDLSNSMADDKAKLAKLGNKLAEEMKTITTNFKLGFGSFVDKTVAPYVNSHPYKLKEPCPKCAAPYGFRNNMRLSSKTREFATKVENAPVSGNLDAPEGGFDALMQAIVCKEEIGWRSKSRKLLVFSTDNAFHYAGDGKLGGIIAPNDEKCHLDKNGYYTMGAELDYPSLSQINRQIRDHKINMIFAVTSDQVNLYEMLSKRLAGSSTGKLENDSSNVVDLVRQQYDKITSAVEMTDDIGDTNIKLSYYSSCLGGKKEQTNICRGLKVGQNVTFEVDLEYAFCPQDPKEWTQTFHIFPVGLHDQLTITLEMMCECECEQRGNEEVNSPKCSEGNGTFECGICNCNAQRYGKECECDASDTDPFLEVKGCFNGDESRPCSGAGKCRCGRCYCEKRPHPDEIYGTYCECTNYGCDKKDGKLCNGPDHGVCDCGSCKCRKGWTGEDCGCRDTIDTCINTNGEICSGRGRCECGSCVCDVGEQEYFGTFCDDCSTCPGMCNELKDCAECFITSQKVPTLNCSVCGSYNIVPLDNIDVKEKEKQCSFVDDKKCRFIFNYSFDEHNQLRVRTKLQKECPEPVAVVAIVSGVSGGVVATGLFLLMLWKLLTVIHDRRELAKFEKERLMAKWNQGQNPLYKEVETTYQNPAYGGTTKSMEQLG